MYVCVCDPAKHCQEKESENWNLIRNKTAAPLWSWEELVFTELHNFMNLEMKKSSSLENELFMNLWKQK